MKRFLLLLLFAFVLNGCDDGDLEVESFDFSNVMAATDCNSETENFFLYKINGKEALIVQINQVANFINEVTPDGAPRIINIPADGNVVYRLYDNTILNGTICSSIPASSPNVVAEWNAVGGTIEIITNVVNPLNETTGATIITGYSHTIIFRNIVFDRGNGTEQTNEEILFGTYETPTTQPVTFNDININNCDSNRLLFKYSGVQALTLDLDQATYDNLFANVPTTAGEPRTAFIDATNKLNYRVFETGLTLDYFCASTTPTTPILNELWEAESSDGSTTGIIEVETTTNGDNYIHTIRFRNLQYRNAQSQLEFSLGTDYLFGEFVTAG